jgi:ABC-type transport system involved in cytochrome c biogenesis permease component
VRKRHSSRRTRRTSTPAEAAAPVEAFCAEKATLLMMTRTFREKPYDGSLAQVKLAAPDVPVRLHVFWDSEMSHD